jgi:SAM-dependent methyltransferase
VEIEASVSLLPPRFISTDDHAIPIGERANMRGFPQQSLGTSEQSEGIDPASRMHEMNAHAARFREIFFEVYEALPRQGPGNRSCAAKALGLCRALPSLPAVLDLGCGVGGQTIYLAELLSGHIVAMDVHAPCIKQLKKTVAERRLSQRIWPVVGDMAHPGLLIESFDLIWSEGALYNIGVENALRICTELLHRGGYLAFSDAVWRKKDPPPEVKAMFDPDYPTMASAPDVLAAIERCGFSLAGHFMLPDEAWWDDFYTPMQKRIEKLRCRYADDIEALGVLTQLAHEPEMHRTYSDYYAYEFFVARRNQ